MKTSNFIKEFHKKQKEAHKNAKQHGFWEQDLGEGTHIALMHSELSEALEALRKDLMDDKISDFKGVEAELADVIIRIMDNAEARGWRVAEALELKMKFNKGRPYKHGNKKF